MLKTRSFVLSVLAVLAVLSSSFFIYAAENSAGKNSDGFASFSSLNVSNRLSDTTLEIMISGPGVEKVLTEIEDGYLVIGENKNGMLVASQTYRLPVNVDKSAMKSERLAGALKLSLPVLKDDGSSKKIVKSKVDRLKKWKSLENDMNDLFNFNMPAIAEDDFFGKKFFDDEFKRIDNHMKSMALMHEELNKKISSAGKKNRNSERSECEVSQRIESNEVIVSVKGPNLNNVDIKVEDNMFKIQNKLGGETKIEDEKKSEKMNYFSSFNQSFTLPVEVESANMKVNKTTDEIIVKLPIRK